MVIEDKGIVEIKDDIKEVEDQPKLNKLFNMDLNISTEFAVRNS